MRSLWHAPAQIAKLIALLLAIVYIIDTVAKERDLLEAPQVRMSDVDVSLLTH